MSPRKSLRQAHGRPTRDARLGDRQPASHELLSRRLALAPGGHFDNSLGPRPRGSIRFDTECCDTRRGAGGRPNRAPPPPRTDREWVMLCACHDAEGRLEPGIGNGGGRSTVDLPISRSVIRTRKPDLSTPGVGKLELEREKCAAARPAPSDSSSDAHAASDHPRLASELAHPNRNQRVHARESAIAML
jgi:hypothetical protein